MTEFYELVGVRSVDATEINKLGEEAFEACGGNDLEDQYVVPYRTDDQWAAIGIGVLAVWPCL